MPKKIKFDVHIEEYQDHSHLPADSQELILKARDTCQHAHAPYSNFLVGAAVLMENGNIVAGSNQENSSYPLGLCAERVALFAAASRFPSVAVKKLAVTARIRGQKEFQAVSPCGGCRQVINEYQDIQTQPIEIIMEGPDETIWVASNIDMLLPFKFSAKHMDSQNDEF